MKKAKSAAMRITLERGRVLVKRGEWWHVEVSSGGVRERRRLGTKSLEEAKRLALEVDSEPPQSRRAARGVTLSKALEEYTEFMDKARKASTSARNSTTVDAFVKATGPDKDSRAVTVEDIQTFIDRGAGRSAVTVRNDAVRIKAFLRWVGKRHKDAVDLHALGGVTLPRDMNVARPVPDMAVVREVLAKLKPVEWLHDLCVVLLETGARPGEIIAARGCDLRGALLDIKPYGTWSPKSKWSVRTIALTPPAREVLERRKRSGFGDARPMFANELGAMRPVKGVSWAYRQLLREKGRIPARFKWCNLYSFRHVWASEHAKEGAAYMPIETMARYLGHAPGSVRVLESYYVDRAALNIGTPASLMAPVSTTVSEIRGAK